MNAPVNALPSILAYAHRQTAMALSSLDSTTPNSAMNHPANLAHQRGNSTPLANGIDYTAHSVDLPTGSYIVTDWTDGTVDVETV